MNEKMYYYLLGNKLLTHGIGNISDKETYFKFESIIKNGGLMSLQKLKELGIIVSGKVSRRGDDDPPIILIDTVKPVDNSNIFTIEFKDEMKFEELVFLKQLLCQYSGSDPVMLKLPDLTGPVKILASSMFWVNSSNDLVNTLHKGFGDRIGISIKSMDTDIKEAV